MFLSPIKNRFINISAVSLSENAKLRMSSIMFSYYEKMCKYLGLYYFNIIAENRYYDITQEEERSDILVCRDLQAKYPRSPANDKKIIVHGYFQKCVYRYFKFIIKDVHL